MYIYYLVEWMTLSKFLRAVNGFHILVASGNFVYPYIAICVADLVKALKAANSSSILVNCLCLRS